MHSVGRFGALAIALACAGVWACSTDIPGFGRDDVKLPEREPEAVDAGKTTQSAPLPAPEETPARDTDAAADPMMDAGTDAPPPRSAFCSEPSLMLCYEFEGAVKDSSVNALDPATVQGVTFVNGHSGMAAQVDSSSAIRFGYSPLFNTTSGATIEAWVALAQNVQNSGVVFDADNRFAMEIESNGNLKCIAAGGSETGGSVTKGTFSHVACVFETSGKIRNYINGVEKADGSGKVGTSDTAGAAIAGNAPSGDPFIGIVDSLRVFRTVRTPAEVAAAAQ
jgi:hypothetical protein